jgi:hypothetical protein
MGVENELGRTLKERIVIYFKALYQRSLVGRKKSAYLITNSLSLYQDAVLMLLEQTEERQQFNCNFQLSTVLSVLVSLIFFAAVTMGNPGH